jgi:hypothetical protein
MVEKKEKQSKTKENQQTEDEVDEKSYVHCSLDMECALADILRERNIGNKSDAGWKTVAYNSASSKLSSQLHIDITADNVKNRIKTWKKLYGIVSDILSQSGFSWDATKKMITVDDDNAWQEYIKVRFILDRYYFYEFNSFLLYILKCCLMFSCLIVP